jgi:hypothetical protein
MTDQPARKKSQKRQRSEQVKTPLTRDEFNRVAAHAAAAGMSKAAYSRAAMLGDAGPRSQRRLNLDDLKIRRVLALHNKYGSNMNQIAYQLNANEKHALEADFRNALKEWEEIRDATLDLLGKLHPVAEEPAPIRSAFIPPDRPIWPPRD